MKQFIAGRFIPLCMIIATAGASCKKNESATGATGISKQEIPFSNTGAFKKEMTINDESGKPAATLVISGNDEQAVNFVFSGEFRVTTGGIPAVVNRQPAQQQALPPATGQPVHIAIKPIAQTATARTGFGIQYVYPGNAGILNPRLLIYWDVNGVALMLRRNVLTSNAYFGISQHYKVIGIAALSFSEPYGITGFPLTGSFTDLNGILCNRLVTEIYRTTVNQQKFNFYTEAW